MGGKEEGREGEIERKCSQTGLSWKSSSMTLVFIFCHQGRDGAPGVMPTSILPTGVPVLFQYHLESSFSLPQGQQALSRPL